jgi:hypothetical protein
MDTQEVKARLSPLPEYNTNFWSTDGSSFAQSRVPGRPPGSNPHPLNHIDSLPGKVGSATEVNHLGCWSNILIAIVANNNMGGGCPHQNDLNWYYFSLVVFFTIHDRNYPTI